MSEMLLERVTRYQLRAEREAVREYDGWGERPDAIATFWRTRASETLRTAEALAAVGK